MNIYCIEIQIQFLVSLVMTTYLDAFRRIIWFKMINNNNNNVK